MSNKENADAIARDAIIRAVKKGPAIKRCHLCDKVRVVGYTTKDGRNFCDPCLSTEPAW